jgi:hypothetical protein
VFGTFIGITLPSLSFKINLPSRLISSLDVAISGDKSPEDFGSRKFPEIYVPTNPRGAELLPPGIVVAKTDFYLRRLWGEPNEVLTSHSIFTFSIYMVLSLKAIRIVNVKTITFAGFEEEAKISCDIYSWI